MKHYHLFKKLKSETWDWHNEKDSELWELIGKEFDNERWESIMQLLVNQNMSKKNKDMITKNSYKLALKIKEETGIEAFPVILQINYGAASKMERYGWKMYSLAENHFRCVYSNWTPKDLLPKKYEIEDEVIGALDVELHRKLR
ncbi:hypothetical protein L8C07_05920 [Paenibacillus sp. CMAA1739]|uniref:hypothetical protein n=1 Tax=Paenibacillus ottowii TaxID=2315729 RepID=UPI002DBC85BA|nr:hypothetical protein [Paenibacillus sp. CMAA1739]MEC4565476.1 hypothetical protein [Paenibacillus sp. CMAA1739]